MSNLRYCPRQAKTGWRFPNNAAVFDNNFENVTGTSDQRTQEPKSKKYTTTKTPLATGQTCAQEEPFHTDHTR